MSTEELGLWFTTSRYAYGFMVEAYKANEGRFTGRSGEWRLQPMCRDPFDSKAEADMYIKSCKDHGVDPFDDGRRLP